MKFIPLGDRVILKRMENVTKTASGLFLPGEAHTKSNQAVVAYVGPGAVTSDGKLIPMHVQPGDHVVAARHAGEDINLDGEEFWLVREYDIQYIVAHKEDE